MKIEHFVARSVDPTQMYIWTNLLGVCGGQSHLPSAKPVFHCDDARKNASLHYNPAKHLPVFTYRKSPPEGKTEKREPGIWIWSEDRLAQQDICTLNLNASHLTQRRKQTYDALIREISKTQRGKKSVLSFLKRRLRAATQSNKLPPFAGFIAHQVEQMIHKRESSSLP